MSYLDTPRLTFFGQFTANPSTVNNTPTNYNMTMPLGSTAWNPNGRHNFSLNACKVTSVCTDAGLVKSGDPIIGASLASTGPAVLVDLDTAQQAVSQIFGLTVQISLGVASITGQMTPVNFFDMFSRNWVPGDGQFSASYQSVLTNVQWSGGWSSPFVEQLQKVSGSTLSIHFVVDGYHDGVYQTGNFTTGRVAGTIGPYSSDEPTSFVNARFLRPMPNTPSPWGNFKQGAGQDRPGAEEDHLRLRQRLADHLAGQRAVPGIRRHRPPGRHSGLAPADLPAGRAHIRRHRFVRHCLRRDGLRPGVRSQRRSAVHHRELSHGRVPPHAGRQFHRPDVGNPDRRLSQLRPVRLPSRSRNGHGNRNGERSDEHLRTASRGPDHSPGHVPQHDRRRPGRRHAPRHHVSTVHHHRRQRPGLIHHQQRQSQTRRASTSTARSTASRPTGAWTPSPISGPS